MRQAIEGYHKVRVHAEEENPKDKRIRELSFENQTLQEKVQELEKALIKLVKIEVRLPECAVCWERDRCTDHSHGDNCLAIGYIVDTAKEAAKE